VSGEDAAFHGLSAGRFTLIITDHAYRRTRYTRRTRH
jgi:hypothetical protein